MAAATLQDIRIAAHPDHIRVVLDLDGEITFTPEGNNAFKLHGLSGGSAVMNAQAKDTPLTRVILAPDGDDTTLKFEAKAAITAKAFPVSAGANGGRRFVVDLYKVEPPVAAQTTPAHATTPSDTATAPQAPHGPAVPAVAQVSQPTSAAAPLQSASLPASDSYAAVAPSNAPEIGPTPYEAVDTQPVSKTSAASSMPTPAIANAAPLNTVPFAAATAQPTASTGAASPSAMQSIVTPASVNNAPASDRTLFAERALDRGDAKAACEAANDSLRSSPQDLRALAVLGSCQLALGDAVAAHATFASALTLDPSYHRARIGLAETDVRQGDLAGARQEYQRILADNPPTDETYKILDALQALAPLNAVTASAQGT